MKQEAGYRHPLLLAAGEVVHPVGHAIGEPYPLQGGDDASRRGRAGTPREHPQGRGAREVGHLAEGHVHADRELGHETVGLVDHPNPPARRAQLAGTERHDVLPLDEDPAPPQRNGSGEDVEEGRLPGARRADDRHPLPAFDDSGDARESPHRPEGDLHFLEGNGRGAPRGHLRPPTWCG